MNVRTKFAFQQYSKGQVLDVQPNVGRLWIQMNRCEEVPEPQPTLAAECAAPAPEALARLDADAVPSAAGWTAADVPETPPTQTRKKHGR